MLLGWIMLFVVIYILIGIGVLIYGVMTDPWGGFLLSFAPLVIFGYPFLWIFSVYQKYKK